MVSTASSIDMPLAYVGGIVSSLFESLSYADGLIAQLNIVDKNTVSQWILTGQKTSSGR